MHCDAHLTPAHRAAMQAAVQWMAEQDIIKLMLRSNLHQRQYMEQVRDILNILTKHQMLHEEHVQLLWDITEKVSTGAACLPGIGGVRSLPSIVYLDRDACLDGMLCLNIAAICTLPGCHVVAADARLLACADAIPMGGGATSAPNALDVALPGVMADPAVLHTGGHL